MKSSIHKILIISLIIGCVQTAVASPSKSVTLQECLDQAAQYHESLPLADLDIQKTKAQFTQIVGAVSPKISAGLAETLQERIRTTGTAANFTRFSTLQTQIGVTQPIFHGLIEFYAMKKNKVLLQQKQTQLDETRRMLYLDVASAYYNAAAIDRAIQTTQMMLNIMDRQTVEYSHWLDLGKIRQSESVRLDTEIAILKASLENLKGNQKIAYEILKLYTGWSPHPSVKLQNPIQHKIQPLSFYIEQVAQRPDIKAAKQDVIMAEHSKSMAYGSLFPQADFAANLYPYRQGIQQNINWDVRFQVGLPLLDVSTHGKIKESKIDLQRSKLALQLKQRVAENNTSAAYLALQSSVNEYHRHHTAADLAYKSYSLHLSDLDHGLVNQFEVLESQKTWLQTMIQRDQSEVEVWQNTVNLMAVSGSWQ